MLIDCIIEQTTLTSLHCARGQSSWLRGSLIGESDDVTAVGDSREE